MSEVVSFQEFQKIDLRVAKILNVEDIEGKDKLYKLEIDVGEFGKRMLIAGVKEFYNKEELQGKLIVIVANLESKRIAGFESQGMLLAAKSLDGSFALLKPKANASAGEKVVLVGNAAQ